MLVLSIVEYEKGEQQSSQIERRRLADLRASAVAAPAQAQAQWYGEVSG